MTDFRYHVVSLIAVFLALAVGVVLGSGPLRSALVGDLNDEVGTLEQQLADAQAQIDAQQAEVTISDQFASEVAPYAIDDVLDGAGVALISVSGANPADIEAQRERIVEAGGSVTAELAVEDGWADPDQSAFRGELAQQLASQLLGVDEGLSASRALAHAVAQALMPDAGPAEGLGVDSEADLPDAANATDRAAVLLDLLRSADLVDGTVTGEVTAVVLVAGAGPEDVDARASTSESMATLAGVLAEYAEGVAAATGPDTEGDLASAVRNDGEAALTVSTVTYGTTTGGRIATVLALAEAIAGGHGHYGPGDERTFVPAGVTPPGESGATDGVEP